MNKIWRKFWQRLADYYFYKWARTKNPNDLNKYHAMLDVKFLRKRGIPPKESEG
jgi:hypothetical protein